MIACQNCNDGSGESVYPYYGLAPHQHYKSNEVTLTNFAPKETWPKNFDPDPESEGMGVYTHCEECGVGV